MGGYCYPRQCAASVISSKNIRIVPDQGIVRSIEGELTGILEYIPPHDEKSLRPFLGILAFNKKLLPNCTQLFQPLNQFLRKGARWL